MNLYNINNMYDIILIHNINSLIRIFKGKIITLFIKTFNDQNNQNINNFRYNIKYLYNILVIIPENLI